MAKVLVQNTREHAIHINIKAGKNKEAFTTVIPGSRKIGDKQTHGQALLDDSVIAEAKKHPVVSGYFREGWLQTVSTAKAEEPKQ